MSRFSTLAAVLMAVLWLPAMLHCDMEAADIHFLTHDDHHSATDHGHETDGEYHALKDAAFTASAPSLKVLLPTHFFTVVHVALTVSFGEIGEPSLAPPCHGPPPKLKVAWQFITRAALPAQAP